MTQKILIVVNDAPYGTEKAYNALRLAIQLGKDHEEAEVRVFLMAEAANCAIAMQKPDILTTFGRSNYIYHI